LQPDEEAEPFSDSIACSSGRIENASGSQQHADYDGPSIAPDCCQRQVSQGKAMNEVRMGDGRGQLQQDHTRMQYAAETLRNISSLKSDEAKYPASSRDRVFPASSVQQHPATPFPCSTAPTSAVCFGSDEKKRELPSVAKPIHSASLYLCQNTPRTVVMSGHETAAMDPKSLLHVVNSFLCLRFKVERLQLTTANS